MQHKCCEAANARKKRQLEKRNQTELAAHGREHFTDKEFDKILLYLEGGTRFEKAKNILCINIDEDVKDEIPQ